MMEPHTVKKGRGRGRMLDKKRAKASFTGCTDRTEADGLATNSPSKDGISGHLSISSGLDSSVKSTDYDKRTKARRR